MSEQQSERSEIELQLPTVDSEAATGGGQYARLLDELASYVVSDSERGADTQIVLRRPDGRPSIG